MNGLVSSIAGLYDGLCSPYNHYSYPIYTSINPASGHSSQLHPLDELILTSYNSHPCIDPLSIPLPYSISHSSSIPDLNPRKNFNPPEPIRGGFQPIPSPVSVDVRPTFDSYYRDNRVLKQYYVTEDNLDDNTVDGGYFNNFTPVLPANFRSLSASSLPNLGFPLLSPDSDLIPRTARPTQTGTPISVPANPRAPLQLGSGSLGVIRLANGAVFLGSGSLGYVNDKQRAEEIQLARNHQSPQPSALTFGTS